MLTTFTNQIQVSQPLVILLGSEYPTVDGHLSINVYLNALSRCFSTLKSKYLSRYQHSLTLADFDYLCFHTPYSKMVQKCFYHLTL